MDREDMEITGKVIVKAGEFEDILTELCSNPAEALAVVSCIYMSRMIAAPPEARARILKHASSLFDAVGNEMFEDEEDAIDFLNKNFMDLSSLGF